MKTGQGVRLLLAFGIVAIDLVVVARAQDPAATAEIERQKRLDQQFQESLGWYLVYAGPESQAPMKPESVLHWTNATRGEDLRHPEPTVILWANAGRPVAQASVYPWGTALVYDCVSLAREVSFTAREDGRTVWSPTKPGVTFRGLSDIPAPDTNVRARLTQMKSLAGRFKVTMFGLKADQSDREEMRLLPKPIYRYKLDDGQTVHPDLIDGAIFAFVQGTDPEALLLVEAIRQGDRTYWQYAFARDSRRIGGTTRSFGHLDRPTGLRRRRPQAPAYHFQPAVGRVASQLASHRGDRKAGHGKRDHRTVGLVISPYVRRGCLDSTQYSTLSMIRTMELILGLPPLSQFDAAATPMFASFTDTADLRPYVALDSRVSLDARNDSVAYGADRSKAMDFSDSDRIDDFALNEILWRAVKGKDAPMPPAVRRAIALNGAEPKR